MPADQLSETELEVLKVLTPMKKGGINIREADEKYGLLVMVGLVRKGFLSLLCATVLIDDAYYCISPEGRENLSKHF